MWQLDSILKYVSELVLGVIYVPYFACMMIMSKLTTVLECDEGKKTQYMMCILCGACLNHVSYLVKVEQLEISRSVVYPSSG